MKILPLFFLLMSINLSNLYSQEPQKPSIYDPSANAGVEIEKAIQEAKVQEKNVLLMIGGNWCPWCIRLHKLLTENTELNGLVKDNYVWVMVNYSKENRNLGLMAELGNPQRFGFPVWVILNSDGKVIHIQDTSLFEMNEDYVPARIKRTLQFWTRAAVSPE